MWILEPPEKSIWTLEKSWKFVSEKGYRNPEQWWLMTTWNKQSDICTILETCHSQFVGEVTKKKLPRALPVYKFVFKLPWFLLEDFLGGVIIMLLKIRLLCSPDILWNHASWSQKGSKLKEEILRSTCLHHSTSVLNSLVVEVSESRLFSRNFLQLALVVVCPSATGG